MQELAGEKVALECLTVTVDHDLGGRVGGHHGHPAPREHPLRLGQHRGDQGGLADSRRAEQSDLECDLIRRHAALLASASVPYSVSMSVITRS